jgi:hypothetical protein
MKRAMAPTQRIDFSNLVQAIHHLDECLKRGVAIGVYEDSLEVSDEDIKKALVNVRAQLDNTIETMEKLARVITRMQAPSSLILQ